MRYSADILKIATPIDVPIDDLDAAAAHNMCVRAAGENSAILAVYDFMSSQIIVDVSHYINFKMQHVRYLHGVFDAVSYYAAPKRELAHYEVPIDLD